MNARHFRGCAVGRWFCSVMVVCAVLLAAETRAATITIMTADGLYELNSETHGTFTDLGDGRFSWDGEWSDDGLEIRFSTLGDADPFASAAVSAVNNTGSTAEFMFEFALPVTVAAPAGSPMTGSSSISVNDADFNGSGTASAPTGGSIYEGRINGVTQRSLFLDPFTLSAPPNGTTADTQSFSGEVTTTALAVGDIISIKHTFVLSADDSATGNSNFFVPAIPEPTTGCMAVLIALPLLLRRRQSSCQE